MWANRLVIVDAQNRPVCGCSSRSRCQQTTTTHNGTNICQVRPVKQRVSQKRAHSTNIGATLRMNHYNLLNRLSPCIHAASVHDAKYAAIASDSRAMAAARPLIVSNACEMPMLAAGHGFASKNAWMSSAASVVVKPSRGTVTTRPNIMPAPNSQQQCRHTRLRLCSISATNCQLHDATQPLSKRTIRSGENDETKQCQTVHDNRRCLLVMETA